MHLNLSRISESNRMLASHSQRSTTNAQHTNETHEDDNVSSAEGVCYRFVRNGLLTDKSNISSRRAEKGGDWQINKMRAQGALLLDNDVLVDMDAAL